MSKLDSMTIETDDNGELKSVHGRIPIAGQSIEFKDFNEVLDAYLQLNGLMQYLKDDCGIEV